MKPIVRGTALAAALAGLLAIPGAYRSDHVERAPAPPATPVELAAIGVDLFYLPPRSPELNDIERVWRSAKYEDYPVRSHTTIDTIGTAVDQALARQRTRIQGSTTNFTKAA